MIKLNSKNITYVALADSNNSLKAPKEIWYADSNNSVKLVYRRKDALIEGVDYEKYHWLISNSEDNKSPYIDTLIPPNLNQNITFSFKVIDSDTNGGEPGIWGAILSTSWNNCVIRCFKPKNYGYTILEYNNNNNDFPQKENMIIKTEFSEGKEYDCSLSINSSTTALGVINNESKELVANSNVSFVLNPQPTHILFAQNTNSKWSFNSVGFKKFNITNLISLVPCKLLKPVPKWLDANGIRRQVGECGMIDLVSGKFYGNVNSVGTFTVENYYERKEWLRAEINVSGRMALLPVNSMNLYFKSKRIIGSNFHYFGTNDYEYYCEPTNVGRRLSIWKFSENTVVYRNTDIDIDSNEVIIDCSPNKIYVNGYEVPIYEYPISHVDIRAMSNTGMETLTSSIFVNGTERYIPCTLTMDLPASMDANNIARTKGTSGMWDLVSDKFYGNVASSGTFKAVNLAEGVDYEVYDWLVGDGTAYIDTNIKISETDIITTKFIALTIPIHHHLIYGTNSGNLNNITLVVFSNNRINFRPTSPEYSFVFNTNTEYETVQSATSINVNGSQVWQGNSTFEESQYSCYVFATASSHINYMFDGKISKFIISDKINLIPVKLLRSIPAKYDANGIARQVGECGMYDTVNDVFYGNVASSGSFTCVNDS